MPWNFGQIEPYPFADRIRQSFGELDLGGLRAHTGPAASTFARSLDARAVTIGSDVAFASRPNLFIAAHEAAHAVQQSAGVDTSDVEGNERNANEVAAEVVRGRSSARLLQFPPRDRLNPRVQCLPGEQVEYNRGGFNIPPPPKGWTYEEIDRRLSIYFKSVTTTGVKAKTPEDFFLKYTLYGVAPNVGPRTETDTIGPTSFSDAKPPTFARMTFRIDKDMNATAEIVGAGIAPPSAQLKEADAVAELTKTFGFLTVKDDGTAKWTAAELSDVVAALKLVPASDLDALKGVELIRVDKIPGAAGEFNAGGGLKTGAAKVDLLPFLKIASNAFVDPQTKFYGGKTKSVPPVYHLILHEVGHAVEARTLRLAREKYEEATIEMNVTIAEKKAGKKTAADVTRATEARKPKEKAYRATRVTKADIQSTLDEAAAKKKTAADELAALKAKIKLMSAPDVTQTSGYAAGIDAVDAAIKALESAAAAKIGDSEKAVEKAQTDRDAKRTASFNGASDALTMTIIFEFDSARRAQDDWYTAASTAARAPHRSKRLQKFIDLVTKLGIEPFTDYARGNWPAKPTEFYAEAYSLYIVDREFMTTNYPDLVTFFDGARD